MHLHCFNQLSLSMSSVFNRDWFSLVRFLLEQSIIQASVEYVDCRSLRLGPLEDGPQQR